MVRASYEQKPYRRVMMETWGGSVVPSPVDDPEHPGSLGTAISDAVRDAAGRDDSHYSLGSVLNHVLLHQTVIGLEAKEQLALAGEERPDIVIGCCGGGSNLGGIALPVRPRRRRRAAGRRALVVPDADRGPLRVRLRRHRRHDAAARHVHPRPRLRPAVDPRRRAALPRRRPDHLQPGQERADAGRRPTRRARCSRRRSSSPAPRGPIPAPETSHAIRAVIDEALGAKEEGTEKVILFYYSGHGLLDLAAYDDYLHGRLIED